MIVGRKHCLPVLRTGAFALTFAVATATAGRTMILHAGSVDTVTEESEAVTPISGEEVPVDDVLILDEETETETETSSEENDQSSDFAATVSVPLEPAGDYKKIHQALYDAFGGPTVYRAENDLGMVLDGAISATAPAENSALDVAAEAPEAGTEDAASFSSTNVQEEGVDEGDFVKTDGHYIYVLRRDGSLIIVSADGGEMESVSNIPFPEEEAVQEMYVDGDKLSVVTSGYFAEMDTEREDVIAANSGSRTRLYTYDITDRKDPHLLGATMQDGGFCQSRKNGHYIYLFSSYSPDVQKDFDDSDLIPITSKGEIDAADVYLPQHLNYSDYLVATCVDLEHPGEIVSQKAVVSSPETFYASQENIYIANEVWNQENTYTEIMKLHYENGSIEGVAVGLVEGYLNDSFSLNEYQGILRVVSTSYDDDYEERNGLYLFDPDMIPLGSIEDLAPGETIRSARFLGDIGYFVTFRQMDPLFSVDLTDPENPKVLGALKVSGFSDYLHFYSEDLLLGLGYEADTETGRTTGLKLSMFDISDPANVTEVDKLVLSGIIWCDSFNDYKSILMDPEKNVFGFVCDDRYMLYSYDPDEGFVKELLYDTYNDVAEGIDAYYGNNAIVRGIYIDDTFYLVRQGVITAFDMGDEYKEIGQLLLPETKD